MKPNTELDTMMFFDDALESEPARPARRRIRLRS